MDSLLGHGVVVVEGHEGGEVHRVQEEVFVLNFAELQEVVHEGLLVQSNQKHFLFPVQHVVPLALDCSQEHLLQISSRFIRFADFQRVLYIRNKDFELHYNYLFHSL